MEFIYRSLDAYYDVFTYLIMLLMGNPLPEPIIPLLSVMSLFPLFFISAFGEEGGWLGYAIDPIQKRWGALGVSLIMG